VAVDLDHITRPDVLDQVYRPWWWRRNRRDERLLERGDVGSPCGLRLRVPGCLLTDAGPKLRNAMPPADVFGPVDIVLVRGNPGGESRHHHLLKVL
jgi:hypothetical protein